MVWYKKKSVHLINHINGLKEKKEPTYGYLFNNSNTWNINNRKCARLKKENLYSLLPSNKIFPVLLHNRNDVCHLWTGRQITFCHLHRTSCIKLLLPKAFTGVKCHLELYSSWVFTVWELRVHAPESRQTGLELQLLTLPYLGFLICDMDHVLGLERSWTQVWLITKVCVYYHYCLNVSSQEIGTQAWW